MIDVAIIGSGPAALTAAIYTARAGLETVVFEKKQYGGLLSEIDEIDNFPGFMGSGADLAKNLLEQTKKAGAKIEYGECESIEPLTIDGEKVEAKVVLIATGSEPKKLPQKKDKPISYCAICDAPLYKNKNVLVVGGGNSAVSSALTLAKIVNKLTLVNRSNLKAEQSLIDQLKTFSNVEIFENTPLENKFFENIDGVFAFIGEQPATSFLPKEILNQDGYIITDENQMSKIKGVFAAGDVREGSIRQAVTAAADGAAAALKIESYLKEFS